MDELTGALSRDPHELDPTRVLWLDFAFHCRRAWQALTDVLSAEHARFDRVRGKAIEAVVESHAAWQRSDTLARQGGSVLGVLYADPITLLSDLLDLEE